MQHLDPKNDLVFKLLFTKNQVLLRSMLEAVVVLPSPIRTLTILNPELMGSVPADKLIVLDIRLLLDDDREVDVEMQCRNVPGLKSRLFFYCCRLHAGDLRRGEDFTKVHPPSPSFGWRRPCSRGSSSTASRGNSYLRALLVQAAGAILRTSGQRDPLYLWANQLIKQPGQLTSSCTRQCDALPPKPRTRS